MANTRADTVIELVQQLEHANRVLVHALAIDRVTALIAKLRDLGDVRTRILALNKLVPFYRGLRTDRTESMLQMLGDTRDERQRLKDLLKRLGSLHQLKNQIALLTELDSALLQRGDLQEYYKQLDADLEEKLDALKQVLGCIEALQRPLI